MVVGVAIAPFRDLDLTAGKETTSELFSCVDLRRENVLNFGLSTCLIGLWNEGGHSGLLLIFRVLDDYLVVVFFLLRHRHVLWNLFFYVGKTSCVFGVFFDR